MNAITICALQIYLASAAVLDVRLGRIPNLLIGLGLTGAVGSIIITRGPVEVMAGLLNGICFLVLLYPLFWLGVVGAGDVKLFSVVAVCLGRSAMLGWIVASMAFGGAMSLWRMLRSGQLGVRLWYAAGYIGAMLRSRRLCRYEPLIIEGSYIPFGLCMFVGFLLSQGKELIGCVV